MTLARGSLWVASCAVTAQLACSVVAPFSSEPGLPGDAGAIPYAVGGTPRALWGRGPQDVWVAGGGPLVARFDGTAWIAFDPPAGAAGATAVGGTQNHVFIGDEAGAIWRLNVTAWTDCGRFSAGGVGALWIAGRGRGYAVGEGGRVRSMLGEGTAWEEVRSPATSALRGLWGTPYHVFAVGSDEAVLVR